ncbi:hypothetical protein D3C75_805240 [compost metagenome]
MSFFLKAKPGQHRIANHQVAADERHLDAGFQLNCLLFAADLQMRRVIVRSNLTVLLRPFQRAGKFLLIVNPFLEAADEFGHIDIFIAHAQVLLKELVIHNRTGDAHGNRTHGQIGVPLHQGNGKCRFGKTQQLGLNIGRDILASRILHILPIDPKSRNALLGVRRQDRSKIDGTGALRSIETPHCMRNCRIHIHGFRTITPAGCHGNGYADIST